MGIEKAALHYVERLSGNEPPPRALLVCRRNAAPYTASEDLDDVRTTRDALRKIEAVLSEPGMEACAIVLSMVLADRDASGLASERAFYELFGVGACPASLTVIVAGTFDGWRENYVMPNGDVRWKRRMAHGDDGFIPGYAIRD